MTIKELHIDGFGIFNNLKLDGFGPGLQVVYGENEAGKSTLLDFIHFTLTGYPRLKAERRNPLNGGNHGGKIAFTCSNGKDWELHRTSTNNLRLSDLTSGITTGEEATLKRLISNADSNIYKNIFAIGLSELFEFGTIGESGMKDRIYSLGTGVAGLDLKSLEGHIAARAETFFKPGARTKIQLKEINDKIGSLRDQLIMVRAGAADYDRIQFEIGELQERRKEVDLQLTEVNRKYHQIKALTDIYPHYLEFIRSGEELQSFVGFREMPDEVSENVAKLLSRISDRSADIDKDEEEKSGIEAALARIETNDGLVKMIPALDILKRNFSKYEFNLKDRINVQPELERAKDQKKQLLTRLGSGFTEEKLKNFRHFSDLRREGQRVATVLLDLKKNIIGLKERIKEDEEKLVFLQEKLRNLNSSLAALPISNSNMAASARERLAALEVELEKIFRLFKAKPAAHLRWLKILLWLMVFTTAVGGFLLWELNTLFSAGLILIALIAAIAGLFFSGKKEDGSHQSDPGDIQKQINQLEREIEEFEQLSKELDGLRADRGLMEKALERKVNEQKHVEEQLTEMDSNWRKLLENWGLPIETLPGHADRVATDIERFFEHEAVILEKQNKLDKIQSAILEFEQDTRSSISGMHEELPFRERVGKIIVEVGLEEEKLRKKKELEYRLNAYESRIRSHREIIGKLREELNNIWDQYDVLSEMDFKNYLNRRKTYRELLLLRQNSEQAIEIRFGKNTTAEVVASLNGVDPIGLEQELESTAALRTELEKGRNEILTRNGQLENQASSLLDKDEQAKLELELEIQKTRLKAEYRNWMIARIAGDMVAVCKRKYENTRQPVVIRRTAEIFSGITQGRYVNLQTEIAEEELILTDRSGRRKVLKELSRGTREQLLLALRMGLIEQYEEGGAEPLPVVLDDVLVNFDRKRASITAEKLASFAKTRQVLFFTCHENMRDMIGKFADRVVEIKSGVIETN